jgi:catechol 2,3-dioxygenase-like lactoylglutathione lyase family enzyme
MGGKMSVDMKFEIAVVPVSDVDRAKEFYGRLGWRLDADYDNGTDFRVIQFTPPGSGCSVIFGRNVTAAAPVAASRSARCSMTPAVCTADRTSPTCLDGSGSAAGIPIIDAAATSFGSANDLASALRRAAAAHGEHEKRIGQRDENWPGWYAAYVMAEQAGTELPQ